jgi:vancomycin permeability regulator SanA
MSAMSRYRILLLIGAGLAAVELVVTVASTWVYVRALDRTSEAGDAPSASVALVLGAKVFDGRPDSYVLGRLDTALDLYRAGRVQQILNSGNGRASAGNEPAVMRQYLEDHGVQSADIMDDPHGYDTAASCRRAYEHFGVRSALVVTQGFHLGRAVALCRHAGIDAHGVLAECDCPAWTIARNHVRETVLARPRAFLTVLMS